MNLSNRALKAMRRVLSEADGSDDEEWWVNYKSGNASQRKKKLLKRVRKTELPRMKDEDWTPRVHELQRAYKLVGELKKAGEDKLAKELEKAVIDAGKKRDITRAEIVSGKAMQKTADNPDRRNPVALARRQSKGKKGDIEDVSDEVAAELEKKIRLARQDGDFDEDDEDDIFSDQALVDMGIDPTDQIMKRATKQLAKRALKIDPKSTQAGKPQKKKGLSKKAEKNTSGKEEGAIYLYKGDNTYDFKIIKGQWHTRHTKHGGTDKPWKNMKKWKKTIKKLDAGLKSGKTIKLVPGKVKAGEAEIVKPDDLLRGKGLSPRALKRAKAMWQKATKMQENRVIVTRGQIRRAIRSWSN